jgi:hypothetical protein
MSLQCVDHRSGGIKIKQHAGLDGMDLQIVKNRVNLLRLSIQN